MPGCSSKSLFGGFLAPLGQYFEVIRAQSVAARCSLQLWTDEDLLGHEVRKKGLLVLRPNLENSTATATIVFLNEEAWYQMLQKYWLISIWTVPKGNTFLWQPRTNVKQQIVDQRQKRPSRIYDICIWYQRLLAPVRKNDSNIQLALLALANATLIFLLNLGRKSYLIP